MTNCNLQRSSNSNGRDNSDSSLASERLSAGICDLLLEFQDRKTSELKRELADCLGLTARSLLRCACLIAVLEERGEDMSEFEAIGALMDHLRRIAAGKLLPEVVIRFAGKPSLIGKVGALPIGEQKRLADGEEVKLVAVDEKGKRLAQRVDPLRLSPEQVKQVFAQDQIRSEAAQNFYLDEKDNERLEAIASGRKVKPDASKGPRRVASRVGSRRKVEPGKADEDEWDDAVSDTASSHDGETITTASEWKTVDPETFQVPTETIVGEPEPETETEGDRVGDLEIWHTPRGVIVAGCFVPLADLQEAVRILTTEEERNNDG